MRSPDRSVESGALAGASPHLAGFPTKAELGALLEVAAAALRFWPPLYVQSILGPLHSWKPPYDPLSEFTIIDPRRAERALEYLSRVIVPSIGGEAPEIAAELLPGLLRELLWRPTRIRRHPGASGGPTFPRERWFFVNGIATNAALAEINARLLVELFHRPLTVIQNATNSVLLDLEEAAIGKEFRTNPDRAERGTFTEPGFKATIAILDALDEPEVDRVVVIAHSQGTIILANVLRAISKALHAMQATGKPNVRIRALRATVELSLESPAQMQRLRRELGDRLTTFLARPEHGLDCLEKLEIYTFANCADRMKYLLERGDRCLPWIEHFANEKDLVARLGILSPYRDSRRHIDIDGRLFERKAHGWRGDGWGHLLNQHYLFSIRDYLEERERCRHAIDPYPPAQTTPTGPRLYDYFRGGSPDLLN